MCKIGLNLFYRFILIIITAFSTDIAMANPVWKCTSTSGQIKFQGAPCLDSDASREQLDISKGNTIAGVAIPVPAEDPITSVDSKNKQHSSPQNNQNKLSLSSCLEYKYEIEKIDAEMRAGYSVRRGERLKLRRRHIDSLLWRRCK